MSRQNIESIVLKYNYDIVFWRWLATVLDIFFLLAMFSLPWFWNGIHSDYISGCILIGCILIFLLYYPVLEGFTGYTIGKYIVRLRVVRDDGAVPGFGRALIRTFFRLFEVNPVLLGGIPAGIVVLLSQKRQRLGDMVAKTFVLHVCDLTDKKIIIQNLFKKIIVIAIVAITILSPLLDILGILLFPFDKGELGL